MDDITKRTIESAREPLIEEIERLQGISAGLLDALKTLVSEHDARQAKYTIPTEPLGIVLARAAIAKAEI